MQKKTKKAPSAHRQEILVLGAGMVGTCAALELTLRGHSVTLLDRSPPGRETSYGNAGIVQREAVEPYAFPRDWPSLLSAAFGRGPDVHYQWPGLLAAAPQLLRYWLASAPASHQRIGAEYARLIAHSDTEHGRLMAAADAEDLVRRDGFRYAYRTEPALHSALAHAERMAERHGVTYRALDTQGMAVAEPALKIPMAGGLHWLQPWTVSDPGALVERYAALFQQRGGRLVRGDAASLRQTATGWQAQIHSNGETTVEAQQAVLALGPWAGPFTRSLGYRLPLFVKRGYHRHYSGGGRLDLPMLDAERGYVIAPMAAGLRITTGAEIAGIDARRTPVQLEGAELAARGALDLGVAVEAAPWMGSRPCSADMKPFIGAAPRHKGLWFDFGHGHQGFTLGPASGRLLADLIEGVEPFVDSVPFSPGRFG